MDVGRIGKQNCASPLGLQKVFQPHDPRLREDPLNGGGLAVMFLSNASQCLAGSPCLKPSNTGDMKRTNARRETGNFLVAILTGNETLNRLCGYKVCTQGLFPQFWDAKW